MNKQLLKREIANVKMLFKNAKDHGLKIFFWSFADGLIRRLNFSKLYCKTHYYRHEACKDYLKKKYFYVIDKYKNFDDIAVNSISSKAVIWRYWHQGIDNVPYPVGITLKSYENNVAQHPVKILDENSYDNYIEVPDYIRKKLEKGQMNVAVFSDYVRLALLKQYGGIWLDSTFYINDKFPEEIDNMKFYTINQGNKRNWVVTRDRWSVGLLASAPNNPLISFCEEFLREYWKNEMTPIAYLMTDCVIGIAYDEIPAFHRMIDSVPTNNTHCFDFLTGFGNADFDEMKQGEMNKDTFIYQLSYKFKWNINGKNTVYSNFGALINKVME